MKQKRIKYTYSNALRIRLTHTMIPRLITSWSKTHCYFRTMPMGWMLLLLTEWRRRRRRMGPPGPGSSQYGSRYSMSRTCGPRDIISLVIPTLGDNRPHKEIEGDSIYINKRHDHFIYTSLSQALLIKCASPSCSLLASCQLQVALF